MAVKRINLKMEVSVNIYESMLIFVHKKLDKWFSCGRAVTYT